MPVNRNTLLKYIMIMFFWHRQYIHKYRLYHFYRHVKSYSGKILMFKIKCRTAQRMLRASPFKTLEGSGQVLVYNFLIVSCFSQKFSLDVRPKVKLTYTRYMYMVRIMMNMDIIQKHDANRTKHQNCKIVRKG